MFTVAQQVSRLPNSEKSHQRLPSLVRSCLSTSPKAISVAAPANAHSRIWAWVIGQPGIREVSADTWARVVMWRSMTALQIFMARGNDDADFFPLEHRQIPMPAELMVPNSRRTPWKALVSPCSLYQRYSLLSDGKLSVDLFVYRFLNYIC